MENTLSRLKKANPELKIYTIYDLEFKTYGKVLDEKKYNNYFDYLEKHTEVPIKDNLYIAHDKDMAATCANIDSITDVFGHMDVQTGFVNGNNTKLNALEYHKSSEINIALTPLVLILAQQSDLINNQLTTARVNVFFLPKRSVVELHPMTLHFSPCKVIDDGFKCGVVLPMGTNMEFVKAKHIYHKEDELLFKTNKWLIAHEENQKMVSLGAYIGLIGNNIEIKY